MLDHQLLLLGLLLSVDPLAPLGMEIAQSYIGLVRFPSCFTYGFLLLAHTLLELALCGFSSHELVHASGV